MIIIRVSLYKILLFILICNFNVNLLAQCTRGSKSFLRSGPGKSFKILWEVKEHTPLKVINKLNHWVQVEDVDGDRSWLENSFLDHKKFCVVIHSKEADLIPEKQSNIRSDLKEKKMRTLAREYETFEVTGFDKNLVRVKDKNGDYYWINKDNLWPLTK